MIFSKLLLLTIVLVADTAEMAPPKWRGRLNTIVQCGTISGIVVGSAINIGTYHILWGWRLSLGLAAVPGSVLLLGKPGIFGFLQAFNACAACDASDLVVLRCLI